MEEIYVQEKTRKSFEYSNRKNKVLFFYVYLNKLFNERNCIFFNVMRLRIKKKRKMSRIVSLNFLKLSVLKKLEERYKILMDEVIK